MNGDSEVIGETRVRNHCTFRWREALGIANAPRVYEVENEHCEACISELRRLTATIYDNRTAVP